VSQIPAACCSWRRSGVDAAKVRLVASNLHFRAADECLQLFGGSGYTFELPIARAFVDARIGRDLFS
jgi:acyl-CoA dehydrogenase